MENKGLKNSVVVGVVVGIIIVAGIIFLLQKQSVKNDGIPEGGNETAVQANPDALPTVEGGTREKIKTEIATPEPGLPAPSGDVAVPKSAVVVGQEKQAAIRTFEVRGEVGKFSPSTIVVNELDVIEIDLNAVDSDYDIFFPDFGVFKSVNKGTSGKIQFQAYPYGEYAFRCKDACAAEGKLVVNQKE